MANCLSINVCFRRLGYVADYESVLDNKVIYSWKALIELYPTRASICKRDLLISTLIRLHLDHGFRF